MCVQEWYFLLSHCDEKVSTSFEQFVINYSSKNCVKENTSPNCNVNFLLVKIIFPEKVYRSGIKQNIIMM
jgi:hypothetical protein